MVYLGIFAFSNPNMQAFYFEGANGAQALEPTNIGGGVPIHDNFVKWFLWTFINCCLCIVTPCLGGLGAFLTAKNTGLGMAFNGLIGCGFGCNMLVAWIMGMVWRFSAAG
jgi:hypothetical protein